MSLGSWLLVAWLTIGAAATVYMIGKRREPVTAGSAAFTVIINVVIIALIVFNRGVCN